MSLPDEEFDELDEEELALLTRRFERLHVNRMNSRRSPRTCYRCGKQGHFIAECPEEIELKNNYKHRPRIENKHCSRHEYKHKKKGERRPKKGGDYFKK